MSSHADPEFYETYDFCRIECEECQRLDAIEVAKPDYDPFAAWTDGLRRAMIALDAGEEMP